MYNVIRWYGFPMASLYICTVKGVSVPGIFFITLASGYNNTWASSSKSWLKAFCFFDGSSQQFFTWPLRFNIKGKWPPSHGFKAAIHHPHYSNRNLQTDNNMQMNKTFKMNTVKSSDIIWECGEQMWITDVFIIENVAYLHQFLFLFSFGVMPSLCKKGLSLPLFYFPIFLEGLYSWASCYKKTQE